MKWLTIVPRLLLGFVFTASGISFFFITPPPLEGNMALFFTGMAATGYFFYLLKFTEIICGLMLLAGWFVPLALVILAPVMLNIFMVHVMMDPKGLPVPVVMGLLMTYLAFFSPEYSPKIKTLFKRN